MDWLVGVINTLNTSTNFWQKNTTTSTKSTDNYIHMHIECGRDDKGIVKTLNPCGKKSESSHHDSTDH